MEVLRISRVAHALKLFLQLIVTTTAVCTTSIAATPNERGASPVLADPMDLVVTSQGIEPDKWGSIWLLKRYIAPNSRLVLLADPVPAPEIGFSFDLPGASLQRLKSRSVFSQLKATLDSDSTQLDYIDSIIHDLEVNIWERPSNPHTPWFEAMFRRLQARYDRDQVPVDCYLTFFDRVASLAVEQSVSADDYERALELADLCPGLTPAQQASAKGGASVIRQMGHLAILREIALGKKVTFVDTREHDEFDEVHLPGARVVRLRDVDRSVADSLAGADLVVPYCVKDFRGYEVAKALKRHGLNRVATLSPNGLKGWLAADLPTVQPGGYTELQAHDQLMLCAIEPMKCLNNADTGPQ